MKIFNKNFSREEYIDSQVNRSNDKFQYCKVRFQDVLNWFKILKRNKFSNIRNVCCLGTRNGREIDLFRIIFNKYKISSLVKLTEVRRNGWSNIFSFLLSFKRSDFNHTIDQINVYGVEINPIAKRCDTFIGSFDNLPNNWENKYDLLYSNSFDQSSSPEKTAIEWKRILKNNGLIIFSFSYDKVPTESDPVGGMTFENVSKIFGGEIIYYDKSGSNYSDLILKISK